MRFILAGLLALAVSAVVRADFNTGMAAFESGEHASAFREFTPLARQGDVQSQYMLGFLFATGQGVREDLLQAYKWFSLAQNAGYAPAKEATARVRARMTNQQVQRGDQLVATWTPTWNLPDNERLSLPPKNVIADIQRKLGELGYSVGAADGVMGAKTLRAIEQYQSDRGMLVDGEPSRELRARLLAEKPAASHAQAQQQARRARDSAARDGRRIAALQKELRALANDARARGAADPWVIERLEALLDKHTDHWPRLAFRDTFADGNFLSNPTWEVVSGHFEVTPQAALRSVVTANTRRKGNSGNAANAILEALLKEVGKRQERSAATRAQIRLRGKMGNAFKVSVELASARDSGVLSFGPTQSGELGAAYRLRYVPGAQGGRLALLRQTTRGESVLAVAESPIYLEDGKTHLISWTRMASGQMTVAVDAQTVIRALDSRVAGDFDDFTLINGGGDFSVHSMTMYDAL